MPIKSTAAVVVTYNRIDKLINCITALQSQVYDDFDILIIDNASTDGTAERMKTYAESGAVKYFNTGANLGGAGGFNFGMRTAVEAGYSYVWIMDDDCYPEPDALTELMKADRELKGDYGFLSGIAYFSDGSVCNMNIQKTGIKSKIEDYESPLVPVIMATFVSAFFKADTIRKYGLPIKDFFIWADDLEYTRRISKHEKCYAVTKSRALHDMHSNAKVGIENDAPDRLSRYSCLYRNEVYVYRREGLSGFVYLFLRAGLHTFKALTCGNQPFKRAGIILKSFFSGFGFKPKVEYIKED